MKKNNFKIVKIDKGKSLFNYEKKILGLLVAIKIMAEKISSANKLKIEIVDFGLDKRIDTNTEITAFRIS